MTRITSVVAVDRRTAKRFRQSLLSWARRRLRHFPWRAESDSYRVLLAEMMLRRTRVAQVVPVYVRFITRYPTVEDVASASRADIATLLKPLGLAWRAENVADMAREVAGRYGGRVPTDVDHLRTLPGVGEYVSNAVACFSRNQPLPIVDTNVLRVLGRVFGLCLTGEARRRRQFVQVAATCLDRRAPRLYNYALLDLAATICKPRHPLCDVCPFARAALCRFHAVSDSTSARIGRARTRTRQRRVV